ncbi:hypothetical protein F2P81_007862 [Scophthalmus maximus]|uniref:Uncharacterized protein n=1 Tax=Scophthalmus maximus TaxID=52904 RepID=A0A6A4T0R6_SCOMX|nr:hypothetical protein F2P81_007862 [Scophthalmus maximus]
MTSRTNANDSVGGCLTRRQLPPPAAKPTQRTVIHEDECNTSLCRHMFSYVRYVMATGFDRTCVCLALGAAWQADSKLRMDDSLHC